MIHLRGLTKGFGPTRVLNALDLDIPTGQFAALLGPSGSGKTTLLRILAGLDSADTGSITLNGQNLLGQGVEAIARLGVSHVPEGRRVFPGLTVTENIRLGASNRKGVRKTELDREVEEKFELFPDLIRLKDALGWTLSGGQLQMVAVARGLMAKPRVLLLDEPSLGLAPLIVQQVFKIVAEIRRRGTTVLLVEQNANVALSVADRGYVLETGGVLVSGKPQDLWNDPQVRAAYLGGHAIA